MLIREPRTRHERLMRKLSFVLPTAVLAASFVHVWRNDFAKNWMGAAAALFVASCFLAVFLWRRSADLEASVFFVSLYPDSDIALKASVELIATWIAVIFILLSLFLPCL